MNVDTHSGPYSAITSFAPKQVPELGPVDCAAAEVYFVLQVQDSRVDLVRILEGMGDSLLFGRGNIRLIGADFGMP